MTIDPIREELEKIITICTFHSVTVFFLLGTLSSQGILDPKTEQGIATFVLIVEVRHHPFCPYRYIHHLHNSL